MQELKIVRGKIQSHYMLVKTDEDLGWNRAIDLCTNIINAHIKHMTDGWIPVEDERLWNILFEEACVEGEQERRIYNRLKETFGGERSDMDGKL